MVKKNLKDQLININKKLKCKNITRIKEIEQIKMTLKADLEKQKIESKKNRDKYNDFLEEEEYLFQEGYEKVLNAISNEDYIEIEGMHNTVFDKYNCGLWYFNKFSNLIGLKKIESPKIYQIDTDVYSSVKEGYNASEKISIKKDVVKEVFNKIGLYKEKKSSSSYYMEIKPNNKFNTLNIYNRNGWEIPNGRFILDYFIKKYIKKDSYFISFNSEDNLSTYTFKNIPTYYNDICIRYRYKNKLTSGCVSDYDFDEKKNQKEFFLILYNDFNLHPDEVEKHRKIVKKSPMSASKKIFYFFQEHNLVPNFIDDEATEWYKRLNNRKKIFEEIYEKEYKPNKILPSNDNHTDAIARKDEDYKFNYQNLLENYDLERIEDNLVEYYISIKSWTEELLNKINDLEKDNEETLIEINKFRKKAISLEERKDNNAFKERGFIFKELFAFSFEDLYRELFELSENAEQLAKKVDKYLFDFKYEKLRELEKKDRPSFYLVAKGIGEKVAKHIKQIGKLTYILPAAQRILEIHKSWATDYQNFLDSKENYIEECVENSIEKERVKKWFQEWQEKRIDIEYRLNQIFESSLRDIIDLEIFKLLEEELYNYKQKIDDLFQNERREIFEKYAFAPAGDIQESFELKKIKFDILNKFMDNTEKILSHIKDHKSKRWVLKWINSWYNCEIDSDLNILEQKEYHEILKNISSEAKRMRKNNMKEFYNDVQAYVKNRKEREKEYNRLLFKMRKEVKASEG